MSPDSSTRQDPAPASFAIEASVRLNDAGRGDSVAFEGTRNDEPLANPYEFSVGRGDVVVWVFPNVPPHCRPAIKFQSFTARADHPNETPHRHGTFESLRQYGDRIEGTAAPGAVGRHVYWVFLEGEGVPTRRLFCHSSSRAIIIDREPPG